MKNWTLRIFHPMIGELFYARFHIADSPKVMAIAADIIVRLSKDLTELPGAFDFDLRPQV